MFTVKTSAGMVLLESGERDTGPRRPSRHLLGISSTRLTMLASGSSSSSIHLQRWEICSLSERLLTRARLASFFSVLLHASALVFACFFIRALIGDGIVGGDGGASGEQCAGRGRASSGSACSSWGAAFVRRQRLIWAHEAGLCSAILEPLPYGTASHCRRAINQARDQMCAYRLAPVSRVHACGCICLVRLRIQRERNEIPRMVYAPKTTWPGHTAQLSAGRLCLVAQACRRGLPLGRALPSDRMVFHETKSQNLPHKD